MRDFDRSRRRGRTKQPISRFPDRQNPRRYCFRAKNCERPAAELDHAKSSCCGRETRNLQRILETVEAARRIAAMDDCVGCVERQNPT